jgi:predicted ATP-grasp superfamily ATP-dependent carboligase
MRDDRGSLALGRLGGPDARRRLAGSPPCLVTPAHTGTGLGVVRDLGRLGVPIIAADSDAHAIGLASRYALPAAVRDPFCDEAGFIDDLLRIGEALPRRAVLFPCCDDHVWAVSRHVERLREHFLVPIAGWGVMARLADKGLQLQAARQAGVDIPQTLLLHSPADLKSAEDGIPFPAVLKSTGHREMKRRLGVKVLLVRDADELSGAYRQASICGPLMLQEVIPGDDDGLYSFGAYHDASSRPLGVFCARKLRQHPRGFGQARLVEGRWSDDVADASLRLLAELSFHGVSETEFRRDPRDGRLKLMEVNARHWLFHSLARRAGVNLSWIAYLDALGLPVPDTQQVDGLFWLDGARDVRDSVAEIVRGQMSALTWLSTLRSVRVDAVCSLDDWGPVVRSLTNQARRAGGHVCVPRRSDGDRNASQAAVAAEPAVLMPAPSD